MIFIQMQVNHKSSCPFFPNDRFALSTLVTAMGRKQPLVSDRSRPIADIGEHMPCLKLSKILSKASLVAQRGGPALNNTLYFVGWAETKGHVPSQNLLDLRSNSASLTTAGQIWFSVAIGHSLMLT